jgi:hypothetical protein
MPKIIVLGAGASYGNGNKHLGQPPLVSGFFQHSEFSKISHDYQPLLGYLDKYLGINIHDEDNSDIEHVFSEMEASWQLGLYDDPDERTEVFGKEFLYVNPLDMLRSLATDVIFGATRWLESCTCPYHDFMVTDLLVPGDSVVSFNYDLIVDFSLKEHANWRESTGYGFKYTRFGLHPIDDSETSDIKLFKPHGSLNWFRSQKSQETLDMSRIGVLSPLSGNPSTATPAKHELVDSIAVLGLDESIKGFTHHIKEQDALVEIGPKWSELYKTLDYFKLKRDEGSDPMFRYYAFRRLASDLSIHEEGYLPLMVMPTPYKPFAEMQFGELKQIWKSVRKEVELCDEIIAIGFSFRDPHFNQLLLETCVLRGEPLVIKVVNRDEEISESLRNRLGKARAQVIPFRGWFEDYVRDQGYSM